MRSGEGRIYVCSEGTTWKVGEKFLSGERESWMARRNGEVARVVRKVTRGCEEWHEWWVERQEVVKYVHLWVQERMCDWLVDWLGVLDWQVDWLVSLAPLKTHIYSPVKVTFNYTALPSPNLALIGSLFVSYFSLLNEIQPMSHSVSHPLTPFLNYLQTHLLTHNFPLFSPSSVTFSPSRSLLTQNTSTQLL